MNPWPCASNVYVDVRCSCDTQLEAFLARGWRTLPTVGEVLELMMRHESKGFKELTMTPLKFLDASERRRLQEYKKTESKNGKAPATVAAMPGDMLNKDGDDDDGGESASSDNDDDDDLLAICRLSDDDVAHE